VKIGPVDPEIALHKVKKKLTQAKYIARSATEPSGLNKIATLTMSMQYYATTYNLFNVCSLVTFKLD